ncbi:MAG TPA: T9SS type A sorting domain-containing protein [Bacteroidia bacterium]|nr:T9SS type A sorting domain-containing protein [Bacteroidia bacterium]
MFIQKKLLFSISILLSISFNINVLGQNLVPNPSFETHTICPQNQGDVSNALPWRVLTMGRASYFNECASLSTEVGIPLNNPGIGAYNYQYPRTGNAYMGVLTKAAINNRSYICAPLLSNLISGVKYYVSMYINCLSYAVPSDRIGIFLSVNYPDTSQTTNVGYGYIPVIPQVENPAGNILSDTVNWVQIAGWYTALGGENYITIGNFSPDSLTIGNTLFYEAFYYIDDVSISTDSAEAASIKRNTILNSINVFPNPANYKIFVKTIEESEIILLDVIGNEIICVKEKEIDVSGFNDGVYFIQVKTSQSTYTQKIIVQH